MDVAQTVTDDGVVAIVRLDDLSRAVPLAEALARGGIRVIEYTFTNRLAARAIEETRAALGDQVLIGAGTVLDSETARIAMLAGAQFMVTPTVVLPVIETCHRYGLPTVIGAFSPTEILTAWQAGASFVKVFPASVGGARYLKDVLGPLPQVRLIPTGGVNVDNAGDFIKAGASAIAAGGNLVAASLVDGEQWGQLEANARALINVVRAARAA